MPRRTTRDEVKKVMDGFFAQSKDLLLADIVKTRQMKRRRKMLDELDALDLVEARYYSYINGGGNKL